MSVGFRIFTQRPLPDPELIRAYSRCSTAPVADAMRRMCAMNPSARLLSRPYGIMAGAALTVRARPGDSLMIHKALNMAGKGDVLVVSGGEPGRALMGELMFRYAMSKGLAGIVVDGPIRDVDCLPELTLPIYAAGSTPGGPYREGPGEINVPVVCCEAQALYEEARLAVERDREKTEQARHGLFDRNWVDGELSRKGCEIIDGMWR